MFAKKIFKRKKRILELEYGDESTNELDLHHHRNWILFPKKKKYSHDYHVNFHLYI